MAATFIDSGKAIEHTPGAAVTAGDVIVQGELVGVAKLDIPANTLGALAVEGVFDFPKTAGVGEAITAGADVFWDAGAGVATEAAAAGANKKIGRTIAAVGDNDTTVRVRMSQ